MSNLPPKLLKTVPSKETLANIESKSNELLTKDKELADQLLLQLRHQFSRNTSTVTIKKNITESTEE